MAIKKYWEKIIVIRIKKACRGFEIMARLADWSKFMNDLLNDIGDSQRYGIKDKEIIENIKDNLIDFLVEHDEM